MNKKTGRRRKRFPLKCVKDGIVVTKCSWKMNLVSDCVVNSWFCALARPRLRGKRAISPVTRWGEGKDSPKAKRVQINTSQDQGNHCVWNPRTSRWKLNPIVKAHVVSQIVTETVRGACGHRDESNRNRLWCQVRSKNCRSAFGLNRATPQVTYRHCWRLTSNLGLHKSKSNC